MNLKQNILLFLYDNGHTSKKVDITHLFTDYDKDRDSLRQIVRTTEKDGLVETNGRHYAINTRQGWQLIPLDKLDLKARLTDKGEKYVTDKYLTKNEPISTIQTDKQTRLFNSILADMLTPDELEPANKFSSDREYRIDKFLRNARLLFSKTKGNPSDFDTVYNLLISVAFKNGFDDLQNQIDKVKNSVAISHLPLDNLPPEIATPTNTPHQYTKKSGANSNKKDTILDLLFSIETLRGVVSSGWAWIIGGAIMLMVTIITQTNACHFLNWLIARL